MDFFESFQKQLYDVNARSFADIALELFGYQSKYNPVYQSYLQHLKVDPAGISTLESIPFLPISFFKRHYIKTGAWTEQAVFESSRTTGATPSTHLVVDKQFYLDHAVRCFQHFFGDLNKYHFLALLPSYMERQNSSLIAMIDHFMQVSGSRFSGYYLNDYEKLVADMEHLRSDTDRKTIVWGVSFALLDLAEKGPTDFSDCLIFETGGMKGRRRELVRNEFHKILQSRLKVTKVFSEYGMTELFSQAYSLGNAFTCSPSMRVIGRDLTDPFRKGLTGETCALNVIDLANWHSIAFIETEDLGKVYADGSFEVNGRMDNSDLRGCNLMVE